jgi:hypothetical protein
MTPTNVIGGLELIGWYLLMACVYYVVMGYPLLWIVRRRGAR